ncbi:hypothetical protein ACH4YN_33755 [Streptomyces griseofuscus]|uniref:hypothetical protein n=1 Tax=Streptomyces griseofuscus TaxID=146922 RepID=UPI003797698E
MTVPEDHPLAQAPSLTLRDLAAETWVFATVGMCQEIPLAACTAAGFTPHATHVGRSSEPGVTMRRFDDAPWRGVFAAIRPGSGDVPQIEPVLEALGEGAPAAESELDRAPRG